MHVCIGCVCVCIDVSECVCVCLYMLCRYTFTYTYACHIQIPLRVYIYVYPYIYTYRHTYTYTYICTYTHIHIHIHAGVYIYIYIYVYIFAGCHRAGCWTNRRGARWQACCSCLVDLGCVGQDHKTAFRRGRTRPVRTHHVQALLPLLPGEQVKQTSPISTQTSLLLRPTGAVQCKSYVFVRTQLNL